MQLLALDGVAQQRAPAAGDAMSPKHSVLVVEDEVLVRMGLVSTLEDSGYPIFEASSAKEAIAILEQHPEIRVVFTDIQMPGTMDGLALAHYVRMRWPPTIIVISSGKIAPKPEDMPSDVSFLAKPYQDRKLNKILANIADRFAP